MGLLKQQLSGAISALFMGKDLGPAKGKAEQVFSVLEGVSHADALNAAAVYRNIAVRTPVGTDASGAAANLIADRLCKKQTVLLVSEDRAALNGVLNNLEVIKDKVVTGADFDAAKFYAAARLRNNSAVEYKQTFDQATQGSASAGLESEFESLRIIDNAFFKKTQFGLSLIECYSACAGVSPDALDKTIIADMQKSRLIRMNYKSLVTALKSIREGSKAAKYQERAQKENVNSLINYIKTDAEQSELDKVRVYIKKVLSEPASPFNFEGHPYARFAMAHILDIPDRSVAPLATAITKSQNPKIYRNFLSGLFPLLLPMGVYYGIKFFKLRAKVRRKLEASVAAFRSFCARFDFLKSVLEHEGLALVIDSMAYGNNSYLKKLAAAMEDFSAVRELNLCVKSLTPDERAVLEFAASHAKGDRLGELLDMLTVYRIYAEIAVEEAGSERLLNYTANYADIKANINAQCSALCAQNAKLLADSFDDDYVPYFQKNIERSNAFLAEINKKEDYLPLRELLESYGDYIFKLFPCFALTPSEVTALLPERADLMDAVVFVNANRISRENGALIALRARTAIVLGDQMQNGVRHASGESTPESLWDVASKRLKTITLRHCCEVKSAELARFSNAAFYKGALMIAPPLSHAKANEALELVRVDGSYDGEKNQDEVKAVIEQLKKLMRIRGKDETVGVVTLTPSQAESIQKIAVGEYRRSESYKKEIKEDEERGEENGGVYFKAAAELDYSRRDYIILSLTYSAQDLANADKVLAPDFVHMLNCAISSANKKLIVVASGEGADYAKSKHNGVGLLAKYLQYVQAVSLCRENEARKLLSSFKGNESKRDEVHKWTMLLKGELEQLGYTPEITDGSGRIALAVYCKEAEKYIMGFEWDFDARIEPNPRERDYYYHKFLSNAGWNITRLWSRDYWQSRQQLIKNLDKELQVFKKQATSISQKEHSGVPTVKIKSKTSKTTAIEPLVIDEILTEIK